MAFVFFLFSLSVVTTILAGAWYLSRKGWTSTQFQTCLLIFAYLALCYATSFAVVCSHPYWEDNGAEEFIPMRQRWGWALLFAGFFQLILSPALWIISWVVSRRRSRQPGNPDMITPLLKEKEIRTAHEP